MVRWDSPLFIVPWSDSDVPIDLMWKAITEGNVKPPNAGTQAVGNLLGRPIYFFQTLLTLP
jgi:protein KTI12